MGRYEGVCKLSQPSWRKLEEILGWRGIVEGPAWRERTLERKQDIFLQLEVQCRQNYGSPPEKTTPDVQ